MKKKEMIYEGKAKRVYRTDKEDKLIIFYKDEATAFNGQKKAQIENKGVINNKISNIFFRVLETRGIPTHLLEEMGDNLVMVRRLAIIPVEVVVRNIVAGSLISRLGLKEGTELKTPVLEFYYKDDELGDPLINEYHILSLELASQEELDTIRELAFKINSILTAYLKDRGIVLVDFKLEFGRGLDGKIYLGDEITPDTCRFWDSRSRKKLDKDRFRKDLGEVEAAYQEILKRLTTAEKGGR